MAIFIYSFCSKKCSSNICMPIEKLLCIFDFVVLLIEFFLIWTSTEIALTHKIIHYVELLYFILKKDQMHNKLYPHYTIYIIFLFCRDMSWMFGFVSIVFLGGLDTKSNQMPPPKLQTEAFSIPFYSATDLQ